ncbi:DUF1549 and DUF1553 domain-containing protein [Planctomycetaceae bacterium]|jgi:hypothetical protein|nr:DUF1549 and DUF1553 domain-containing protein [Planctomycetaceae bacterium]MDG2389893.1 DUF1549 and DUF1553 domain-containing protein [Planctomycetaceae bacterium]
MNRPVSISFRAMLCGVMLFLVFGFPYVNSVEAQKKKPQKPSSKLPVDAESVKRDSPTKVESESLTQVRTSAAKIDALVAKNYKKFDVKPNPRTTDEQFLRRMYLDANGSIPNLRETKTFLNSTSSTKRERLIDFLLGREGYVAHQYNYWADLLRPIDREGRLRLIPYQTWIKQSLRDNKPYDEFVSELLTAEGKVWENPAVGYYLTDDGMPLDNMNNTIQLFLGTRIGCAQCHDHPFDKWTQKEFYQIASFTGQMVTRSTGEEGKAFGQMQKQFRSATEANSDKIKMEGAEARYGVVQNLIVANRYNVSEVSWKQLKLPKTYAYDDAKPESVVQPKTLFGEVLTVKPGEARREVFARWVTSPKNPRFAKTIANRLWKQLMGVGQIEPVDDMQDGSVAENPELMAFLESEMIRVEFDMKEFLRIIMNTKTYQRQASYKEWDPAVPYHFPGPTLRRMSAEQAWDSLLTLAIPEPAAYSKDPSREYEALINVNFSKEKPADVLKKAIEFDRKIAGGKARTDKERPYSYVPDRDTYQGQYVRMLLARAYELPSPLPPGHFLRQFGQSDRELIGAASTDGSIPQILTMLNGPSTHMMLEPGSEIYENVMRERSELDQIGVIFLSILSRQPSSAEKQLARKEIKRAGNAGYGNVIWALVNTREFLFVQ